MLLMWSDVLCKGMLQSLCLDTAVLFSDDSMNVRSITFKKRTYSQSKAGLFKIDIRLLYDLKHSGHDLLVGEVGKDGNTEKSITI